ncbi:MFS transporter [Ochrobactrum sp. MYb15]|uniref:MFS transporter n=1 Tax=Brucella pituitosa TaxID=571256 RepID=UPI000CFACAF2|nr:MFS transporter [Ochrobactrum sp. MYb19]PRA53057.1 MFS transporter [Ochrobactrum sp. MYb68]PRA63320.1 MFS transporter [Ochrobactrum sp. MYb18]PRA73325.1 MFS transporter [Brucella thiophenivorans]PRA88314.1 MFS transporter [Ochrobactrum sp. MYb14]PRA94848.1 MFS transporter [Ochrobactrum sp. MYb15]
MIIDTTARKISSRLSIAVSTIGFNQTAFIALVPLIATATGLQTGEIGLTAGLGAVAFVVSAPLCGMLGTRIGARRALYWLGLVLLLAQLIFLVLMMAGPLPYVMALGLLVMSRFVYGAASAGIMPIAQAWISGLLPQKERTVALARLSAGLSIGRILGSAAAVTASVMPLLPLMLLVASPLSLLLVPAANGTVGKADTRSDSRAYLSPFDGRLLPFLGLGFLVTMSFGHVQMILGPLLQLRLAIGPAEATAASGITLIVVALAMIATQILVIPRLRLDNRTCVILGTVLLAAGVLLVAATPLAYASLSGLVMGGVGMAIATPNYLGWLTGQMEQGEQGAAAGWLASAHVLGQGAGAISGGYLFTVSAQAPLFASAILAAMAALVAFTTKARDT